MTREEAIKELEILKQDYWDDDGYGHETKQYDDTMLALDMAIEALNQKWIPVTEKRPVEFEKVLVTYRLHYDNSIHVGIGNIIANEVNGRYHWNINEQDYIGWDMLAWMPLPQPYKAESEDKEWQSVNL